MLRNVLTRKRNNPREIHEARQIRDAEMAEPGIVKRTIDPQRLRSGAAHHSSLVPSAAGTLGSVY
jgi:hypothetical protein